MENSELRLKVMESVQDDVNKGITRIDSTQMRQIGVKPGDIIEIEGEKTTVALIDRAYPGDLGLSIIRMDGIIRRNAKTSIGEMVRIRKAEVKEAKKVIVAPARKGIVIRASPNTFKQGLLGRAVLKGDIVSLGGTRRRQSTMTGSPFDDIFRMLEEGGSMNGNLGGFGFGDLRFVVADASPKGAVLITDQTEVILSPQAIEIKDEEVPDVTYEDIGGLQEEVKKIREMVELPLKHPEIFERLGIEAPKGVLLHGPPGTGKTLLAKAVASESNSHFIVINGPEIMSKFYGQSEENLRKKFEEAEKNSPSIIFIDEIDAIAQKREESKGEVERRVVAQLLALMDGLKSRGKVVVIAATNIPNSLDPALRRPGRFDREIEIGVPGKEGRKKVLNIHTRNMPLFNRFQALKELKLDEKDNKAMARILGKKNLRKSIKDFDKNLKEYLKNNPNSKEIFAKTDNKKLTSYIEKIRNDERVMSLNEIAGITYGFVGADLESLSKEAAMVVLRRILPDLKLDDDNEISKEILDKLIITKQDFYEALKTVRPSAMREVFVEIPNIKWNDIGGLENTKQKIQEAVEWPLNDPQTFKRMHVKPPKGVLMYGAPGTGKTLLAKAVANESKANFILVKGPELLSKWVGESEKAVREVFKKARQTSPTIIFFDEIDALAPRRSLSSDSNATERVVNQLLTEMDGLEEMQDVVIIAATNRPDMVDPALLRPGRFDRVLLVPSPDKETRKKIFEVHTKGMPMKSVNLNKLANATDGYVGADIEAIAREAAIIALRKDIESKEITMKDFEKALEMVRPSVTKEVEETYQELEKGFKAATAKQIREESPNYFG